jgi:hypothetical protein
MADFAERDWKYLRSIHDEMLSSLCDRINRQAADIIQAPAVSEHAKYQGLHKHIQEADDIIAACFNDWRRSTIAHRASSLRRHKVLTQDQFDHLSPGAQEVLTTLESVFKRKSKPNIASLPNAGSARNPTFSSRLQNAPEDNFSCRCSQWIRC